jgi:hypothetical protein
LGGSPCPGAAASRSQIGKFGFSGTKLRLDYRRGSSDVGRSGRSNVTKRAIVAIENLALDAESGVLQFFTFDGTGNPLPFHKMFGSRPSSGTSSRNQIRLRFRFSLNRSGGSRPLHLVTAQHWSRAWLWRKTREGVDWHVARGAWLFTPAEAAPTEDEKMAKFEPWFRTEVRNSGPDRRDQGGH